ncbi:uncharacterized protein CC84DRAFT_1223337 [Paraphaeosphaeria sporulosa]|uniref:GST N-terminal domain-containing protein n=1 Tax=Paraphaeosphaeria sporulosa TaxID=1460663 RepID=A0A177BUR5_9PLEO|nr:uncharacterized protein CC84DRAFT_1223337 [Paraphaeosphaeria sporulosa]OAF99044.1 hypothetical protein CC84DRAFT_1223337 [Paraphaeosphaeria sporulosa]
MAPFGTLHTTTTFLHARVTKILAAANLNGLDVQVEPNFQYGITNKTPAYLAKFPHGKIPAFETPTGFYLAEASAIAFYIADSGPLRDQLLGRTPEDRALVQMWVGFADSGLWVDGGAILGPMLGTVGYNAEDVAFHDTQFMRCLRRLEEHLAGEGKVWLVRDEEGAASEGDGVVGEVDGGEECGERVWGAGEVGGEEACGGWE